MRLNKTEKAYVSLIELNGEVAINRADALFKVFMTIVRKGGFGITKETNTHTYFGAW